MRTLLVFFIALLCSSCKGFLYHPSEVRPDEKNLNALNIEKINKLPSANSFKFILVGDIQRFYDELDDFIDHVNRVPDIAFVLINGDIVDFGLNLEYNLVAKKLSKLQVPYVTTIGNHDMLANGRLLYKEMFGPENFTFSYSGSKFICFNDNSREVGYDGSLPDMNWLKSEVAGDTTSKNIFFLSHIPPFSGDFDAKLANDFAETLASNPRSRLSMHGHIHQYWLVKSFLNLFPYLNVGAGNQRSYALITVSDEHYDIEQKFY
jgi:3',5'-cyclic-AMP phosphodiesterase